MVEFITISVLTGFGVPGGAATAGVLCWRLVNFWLPIPFGGGSYLSLRLGHRVRRPGARRCRPDWPTRGRPRPRRAPS